MTSKLDKIDLDDEAKIIVKYDDFFGEIIVEELETESLWDSYAIYAVQVAKGV